MDDLLTKLAEPFVPSAVSWKPGATKDNKCLALAYADLRAYQDRLDEVCGMDWSVRYLPWGDGRIICELTISGVTRASTGEHDAQDEKNNMAGTVAEAQAMKRAAAQFGLGRYLYDLPSVWVAYDASARKISKEGQAELDKRYKDWYARKTASQSEPQDAQNATRTAQKAATGTITPKRTVDASTRVVEGDVLFEKQSQPHQRFWGIGQRVFGNDWGLARPWLLKQWSKKTTPDNVRTSASDFGDDEKDVLSDYMNETVSALQKAWEKQKAILLQSTEQKEQVTA